MPWEPFVDRGDVDGGFVADGEFVEAGGHGAVAFEPVYPALHRVAGLVAFGVEGGRTAPGPAPVLAVAGLVSWFGDGAPDCAAPQVSAVGAGAAGLVAQDPVRASAGPPAAGPADGDAFQDGLGLGAVAALAGGK